jgi:uncharacterized membrane protein YsdA (DUF1294 family)
MVYLLPAFLMVNLWTYFKFWQDKTCAINGKRRVPEFALLRLAFLGGSPGALLARHVLRHKTRKQPFSTYLIVIAALQTGALIGIIFLKPDFFS